MAIFTEEDFDKLSGPHVARIWLAEIDLPTGLRRVHNGVGTITVNGQEWRGITDPAGGQLVGVTAVEDPRFGQAPSVVITLGGITAAVWKEIKEYARDIEGSRCDMWWAMFDPETQEIVTITDPVTEEDRPLVKKLFPGKISAPTLQRQGPGVRFAAFTVESLWQSQNYPFGGRWNAADQERRFPGDKGGQFIGVRVSEVFNG